MTSKKHKGGRDFRDTSDFFTVKVEGPKALFNQPSNRSERLSSIIPSHSASVGILRGILGHRAIDWEVSQLTTLSEPRYHSIMTNECDFDSCSPYRPYHRRGTVQRTSTFLRDYSCLIKARFHLNPWNSDETDSIVKFENMFRDRMNQGAERRHIYLGISECKAFFSWPDGTEKPFQITRDLGIMFYDRDWYARGTKKYYFAPMQIVNGVVNYPSWDEVRATGLSRNFELRA